VQAVYLNFFVYIFIFYVYDLVSHASVGSQSERVVTAAMSSDHPTAIPAQDGRDGEPTSASPQANWEIKGSFSSGQTASLSNTKGGGVKKSWLFREEVRSDLRRGSHSSEIKDGFVGR